MNLSNEIVRDFSIAFFKLLIDNSPHPSNFFSLLYSKSKISDGSFIKFKSQNCSITFFPNPSTLNASFETICFNFSLAVNLQSYPLKHLRTASNLLVILLNSFLVSAPHKHFLGKTYFLLPLTLFEVSTETT